MSDMELKMPIPFADLKAQYASIKVEVAARLGIIPGFHSVMPRFFSTRSFQ